MPRDDNTDMTEVYNTKLSDKEEREFQTWLQDESARMKRDISKDLGDYDVRGSWKNRDSEKKDARGHGTDKWKKPNHPTFSNESVYHGKDGHSGGKWAKRGEQDVFVPSSSNRKHWNRDMLMQYFELYEPDVELVWDK